MAKRRRFTRILATAWYGLAHKTTPPTRCWRSRHASATERKSKPVRPRGNSPWPPSPLFSFTRFRWRTQFFVLRKDVHSSSPTAAAAAASSGPVHSKTSRLIRGRRRAGRVRDGLSPIRDPPPPPFFVATEESKGACSPFDDEVFPETRNPGDEWMDGWLLSVPFKRGGRSRHLPS